jgi:molecular chaperone GrpE
MDATQDTPKAADQANAPAETPEQRVTALEKEVADLKEARLRAVADLQNTARRGVENEARARSQGVMGAARAIFPVLDHVDLALQQKGLSAEQAAQALAMLREELARSLEKVGVERIDPKVGQPFDPGVHEAVMKQAVDGVEPGCVSMAFQSGYRLGDSVLRPAKVAVQPTE